jgi:hypothetical protein
MRMKAAFLLGGAVGYVMGTRAGREQFEKIRSSAQSLWSDPRVQEKVSGVQEQAGGFVREKAPELKSKVTGAVRSAKDRGSSTEGGETWSDDARSTDSLEAGGDLTADSYRPSGPTSLS